MRLFRQFRQWETASQVGFLLALFLIIPAVIVSSSGPEDLRQPATIGAMGLVMTAQVIFMWANRTMVTPFTKAQRHYLRGDFESARRILEQMRVEDKDNLQSETLLGNTYRQLGMLSESETILYEAVNNHPNHYFPLYGFGRTLLVKGDYVEAASAIERALEHGAPPVTQFDAGEAYYRLGDEQKAQQFLKAADVEGEPHRALMKAYWLYQMGMGQQPSDDLINVGLDYWVAQAKLFAHTPYGRLLSTEVEDLA